MRQSFISMMLCLFCVVGASTSAQTSERKQAPSPMGSTRPLDHRSIHAGDLIEIDLVGSLEGDWRGYVGPEGFVGGYALLEDPLYVLCRRPEEVARELESLLSRSFREPKVRVTIVDRSRRPVAVLSGAVKRPHRFQIRRNVTLRELIVAAGGLSETVSGMLQVYRPNGLSCRDAVAGEPRDGSVSRGEFFEISIADMLAGNEGSNPEIGGGDIITVFQAAPVYVVGGVARPMPVATRSELTLSRAVLTAGGVSKSGDPRRVRIFRSAEGEGGTIEADLTKISSGAARDPVLRPFDVVEVAEKGRPVSAGRPFARLDDLEKQDQSQTPLIIIE